jgi:hypothetical protein
MKRVLSVFLLLSVLTGTIHAQDLRPVVRAGAGYARDFPGLSGVSVSAEIIQPFMSRIEGGFGLKRVQMEGYPRTSAKEFTKATTLDFSLYFLPLMLEQHQVRIGMGYSFTFYKIRRSFPVMDEAGEKVALWNVQDQKGKGRGFGFSCEYEYLLPESDLSLGLRASLFKAYDGVSFIGPFVGLRL